MTDAPEVSEAQAVNEPAAATNCAFEESIEQEIPALPNIHCLAKSVLIVKKVHEKAGRALLLRKGKGIANVQMMRNMVLVDYFTRVKKIEGVAFGGTPTDA